MPTQRSVPVTSPGGQPLTPIITGMYRRPWIPLAMAGGLAAGGMGLGALGASEAGAVGAEAAGTGGAFAPLGVEGASTMAGATGITGFLGKLKAMGIDPTTLGLGIASMFGGGEDNPRQPYDFTALQRQLAGPEESLYGALKGATDLSTRLSRRAPPNLATSWTPPGYDRMSSLLADRVQQAQPQRTPVQRRKL